MSDGTYVRQGHTVFPTWGPDAPWCVARIDDTGRLYSPFWFRTEDEAKAFAKAQDCKIVIGFGGRY